MVERYSREIMAKKWDMQAKYDAWLKVILLGNNFISIIYKIIKNRAKEKNAYYWT